MNAFSEPVPETWARFGGLIAELFTRLGRHKPLNAAIARAKRHESLQNGLKVGMSMQWGSLSLGTARPGLANGLIIAARAEGRESIRHVAWDEFTARANELPSLVDAAVAEVTAARGPSAS